MKILAKRPFSHQLLALSALLPVLAVVPCRAGGESLPHRQQGMIQASLAEPCPQMGSRSILFSVPCPPEIPVESYRLPARTGSGKPGPAMVYESPPLGTFGRQFLRNLKGIASRGNLWPVAIGSAATGISAVWDDDVKSYFSEKRRLKVLGDTGGVVGNGAILGALTGGMLLWSYQTDNHHFRSMAYTLTQGFIVNVTVTTGIKVLVRRRRPSGENRLSFPSGHTSAAFTSAAVTAHYYPKAAIPAYATAGLIGISRLEKNKHWLSDVVSGAAVGLIVGRTVISGSDTIRLGKVSFWPTTAPDGGIAVLALIPVD